MKNNSLPIVGVSCGDPNGIGIEIILKSFQDERILEFFTPVIFSNDRLLLSQKNTFNLNLDFHTITNIARILVILILTTCCTKYKNQPYPIEKMNWIVNSRAYVHKLNLCEGVS